MPRAPTPQLPSNAVIPDSLKCAVVLEAVQGRAPAGWRYARHPWLLLRAPASALRGRGEGKPAARSNKRNGC